MTLCNLQKDQGRPSYEAPTRYKRNQAVRYYSGAQVKYKNSKSKRKKKKINRKTHRGFISGATTVQIPFVSRVKTYKHHLGSKGTYGAAELHAIVDTIHLALDTLQTLPEDIQTRPMVFYSNSKYVLDGITKYLPKWKELNWKSIRYIREQQRTQEMNEENDKRWPHIAEMVEGAYVNPLKGTISNVELWQELDELLSQLNALPNKVFFRKCNRRRHLKFRKRTLKAAKDALYEASVIWGMTKTSKNRTVEQIEQDAEEDRDSCRTSHRVTLHRHLHRYLSASRKDSLPVLVLDEGSTPSTTTSTHPEPTRVGFSSIGQEVEYKVNQPCEVPPSQSPQPGNDHIHVSVGTNKLPTRLTPVSTGAEESACYPIKVPRDPTSMTTLSLSDTFSTSINKRCDETSIARDDLSVGDYKVANANHNDRDLKISTRSDLQEGMIHCPPPIIPCLPGVPLFAGMQIEDLTPVQVERNPNGGINLRKGKRVVHGIRTDLPIYKEHCHDLNWWFR